MTAPLVLPPGRGQEPMRGSGPWHELYAPDFGGPAPVSDVIQNASLDDRRGRRWTGPWRLVGRQWQRPWMSRANVVLGQGFIAEGVTYGPLVPS